MQHSAAPARILVGLDRSEATSQVLDCAVTLARCFDAELVLLHVAVPGPLSTMDRGVTAERVVNAARLAGAVLLAEARAVVEPSVRCATELVFGSPGEVICQRARELNVDLIVVGSRRLGGLDRLLLGSVSAAVVQRAPCSVLVVRPRATARP